MKENIRKVKKSRIYTGLHGAVKRGEFMRFSRWCDHRYGTRWRGIYENFRMGVFKRWKWEGIESCIREFCPGFEGKPEDLWAIAKKSHLCDFMGKKDMSRMTVWKRFTAGDWTELELRGIRSVYQEWKEASGEN